MLRLPRIALSVPLVLALAAAASAQEEEPAEARVASMLAWRRAELAKAADGATKKGYLTLARRCWQQVVARDPDDSEAADRLAAAQAADDAAKLAAKARASLEAGFTKLRVKLGARTATLAASLAEGGDEEAAVALARVAVADAPGTEAARKVLGQERLKGWGWVSAEDAARLRSGEVPIGDGWRPKKGLAKDPRAWGEEWRVTSDHFVIHSNLGLQRVLAARDLLEALRERFLADWEGTLPLVGEERRHEVYVFARKAEYDAFLREHDPQHITGVPGQYSPTYKRSTFFDVETLRAAGGMTSSLEELMLHECTHQLFHELVAIRATAIDANDSPNAWMNEGSAEFYGMHTLERGALVLDRKAIRGMLRTTQVRKSASRVASVTDLTAMTKGEFQSPDAEQRVTNYATSGFLCLMLSEGDTRGPWQRFVRAFFCDGNPKDAFEGAMGDLVPALDARFAKFLRKL